MNTFVIDTGCPSEPLSTISTALGPPNSFDAREAFNNDLDVVPDAIVETTTLREPIP